MHVMITMTLEFKETKVAQVELGIPRVVGGDWFSRGADHAVMLDVIDGREKRGGDQTLGEEEEHAEEAKILIYNDDKRKGDGPDGQQGVFPGEEGRLLLLEALSLQGNGEGEFGDHVPEQEAP